MRKNTPKTEMHKWYYRTILIYPDGSQETNQSVTYSKTHFGAVKTIKTAARICGAKILEMEISINPIREG